MNSKVTDPNLDVIQGVFKWFNSLSAEGREIKREDIAQYFSPDMQMITNDAVKCSGGIEALYKHFVEIRHKMSSWEVLPFEITVSEGDRVAGYYRIRFALSDGTRGKVTIIAIWAFHDRKITNMTEVAHFSGPGVDLESY